MTMLNSYCQSYNLVTLQHIKQDTEAQLEQHVLAVAKTAKEHSDVSAAITLKTHGFSPGDVIDYQTLRRVRVENESLKGHPMGQPITADGRTSGACIILYDSSLATARKVG